MSLVENLAANFTIKIVLSTLSVTFGSIVYCIAAGTGFTAHISISAVRLS